MGQPKFDLGNIKFGLGRLMFTLVEDLNNVLKQVNIITLVED